MGIHHLLFIKNVMENHLLLLLLKQPIIKDLVDLLFFHGILLEIIIQIDMPLYFLWIIKKIII
jgi:hypothetical protein